jgi:bacillithiol biosynthesis cysteine-adding enzyme BshC
VQANSAEPRPFANEPAVRIPVDLRRFPWMRRLAVDYAYAFHSVAPFFSGDPSERSAWVDAIARIQRHDIHRDEIVSVISKQQELRLAPRAARDAASLLLDRQTVAVVTGQQAGLFGGPLFTLLKALTALKLAAQLSRDHHVPAVAIFWIDAEDHDWEEVRSCRVFDEHLAPRAVSLPPRHDGESTHGGPVGHIRLSETIFAALDELNQVLPPTEFRPSLLDALRHAYQPGQTMSEAFGRWMEHVLGHRGLIVYDSSDPTSKPLASQVFQRELSMPGETVKLASLAGSDLVARGYHAQVQTQENSLALFRLNGDHQERQAIRQQDGHLFVGDKPYPPSALVQAAVERPSEFSPNVLLRPVVQDTMFPTVCYVAGPSELAYLGQLRGVYEHFGVPMPLMYPRATATVVDSPVFRFLTKYKLPIEALQAQDEAALNELLKAQIPREVEQSFEEAQAAIDAQMARVVEAIPSLDPTLEGAARSTLGRMRHDLETLHGKMIQAAKRRDETLRRQFMRAQALAFPEGHAQERWIGFVSFLNQYGPALVDRLDEELPLDLGRHWIVTI